MRSPALMPHRAAWAAAALVSGAPVVAHAMPCPSFVPNCPYSVSGKHGAYLKQVASQKLPDMSHPPDADHPPGTDTAQKRLSRSIYRGDVAAARLEMPETAGKIEALLTQVAANWPYAKPSKVVVHMAGITEYNASAQADYSILVNMGLLERAQSDGEVAWVLSHEYSHILLGHVLRPDAVAGRKGAMDAVWRVVAVGSVVAQMRLQQNGQQWQLYNANQAQADKETSSAWAREQELKQMMAVGDFAFQRDQEDQADAMGFDLANAANFDAEDGAAAAFKAMSDDDARAAARRASLESDLATLAKQSITTDAAKSVSQGDIGGAATSVFDKLKQNVITFGVQKASDYLHETHRPADVRLKSLSTYINDAYPTMEPKDPSDKWLKSVRASKEYKEADLAVLAHDEAQLHLEASEPKLALVSIQKAAHTRFANAPLIADEAAAVYKALGELKEADRRYEIADASPDQSVDGFQSHVQLLIDSGQYDRALAKITVAEGRLGDHDAFLPHLIAVALKQSKLDSMDEYMRQCVATEHDPLIQQCRYAVLDPQQRAMIDTLGPADRLRVERALAKTGDTMSLKAQPMPKAGPVTVPVASAH